MIQRYMVCLSKEILTLRGWLLFSMILRHGQYI